MEWESLSAEEQAEVAAMDPAEFSEWRAARERGQAAEWRQRELDAGDQAESRRRPRGRFNRLAVVAFVVSLLAIAVPVTFIPILAIIMGVIALRKITDEERGRGLAQWAIALGALNIVVSILVVVL